MTSVKSYNPKQCNFKRYDSRRDAFTLIELLVVVSIIGILVAVMLPAVQYSREAARRTQCSNNVRNHVLALQQFHDKHNQFPAGRGYEKGNEFSWCLEILPNLEQGNLSDRYVHALPWDHPANLPVANVVLSIFRCPSSVLKFDGDTDYGGIMGSSLTTNSWADALNNGVLIDIPPTSNLRITMGGITDGVSQTICVGESSDRPDESGRWISGFNCFSHDNGAVTLVNSGEIFSAHRTGAYVGFVDGATKYLTREIDSYVVGAICTRDHGELFDDSAY